RAQPGRGFPTSPHRRRTKLARSVMRSNVPQVGLCPVQRRIVLASLMTATGLVLAATSGCSKPPPESPTAAAEAQTPAVTVVKPQRRTVRYPIRQPGYTIEAFQQTPVYAKVAGYVGKVNFDIGDRVRKDEVLAELSVPEMHVELRQKDALVKQADAEV